jgi:cytosine/adenosine deaminase-related metal-dependent hydrolase
MPLKLGRQPHAPTTVSLANYHMLYCSLPSLLKMPMATHLGETPEEHEFVATGGGQHAEFLRSLGLWDASILETELVCDDLALDGVGCGKTPVQHLAPALEMTRYLCAHVNDASDEDIAILARTESTVAYCPRASDYFKAHDYFGPHRYRDMLEAGINVCLGTDSIINLPPGTDRLSTLDEMRFLYRRDKTLPLTLLQMATINGAKALGLDEQTYSFTPGAPIAGVVAVPFSPVAGLSPLAAALSSDTPPELLLIGK